MKILKEELKEYIKHIKAFPYYNLKEENNALFFPIDTGELANDMNANSTIILTEYQERGSMFSNSAKPGLLLEYDENDKPLVYLAYVVMDNQKSINLKAYAQLLREFGVISKKFNNPLIEKEAYITTKNTIVGLFEI